MLDGKEQTMPQTCAADPTSYREQKKHRMRPRTLRLALARVAKRVAKERSEYRSPTRQADPQCLSSVGTTSSISLGMPSERSRCRS